MCGETLIVKTILTSEIIYAVVGDLSDIYVWRMS